MNLFIFRADLNFAQSDFKDCFRNSCSITVKNAAGYVKNKDRRRGQKEIIKRLSKILKRKFKQTLDIVKTHPILSTDKK